MRKYNQQNNINFSAIKLKNSSFKQVRDTAMFLKMNCFNDLGFKIFYVSKDNTKAIQDIVKNRRENNLPGYPYEFGTIFFPWSKEAYIIASPAVEQEMITLLKDYCPSKATINLLL